MAKKQREKEKRDEKERLEDVAGYDRKFDPLEEAKDLRIARERREKKRKS